jgi:hypothetical protein
MILRRKIQFYLLGDESHCKEKIFVKVFRAIFNFKTVCKYEDEKSRFY